MSVRVAWVVGAFDGVVIRSIIAGSIEQVLARAETFCDEFRAAQNYGRDEGDQITITLDVYVAVNGGEKVGQEWSAVHDRWMDVCSDRAGLVLYQYRYKPGTFEDQTFRRVPEIQEVIGL